MNVRVVGLGRFASIVAVCLAQRMHHVSQWDYGPPLLRSGHARVEDEPGFMALRAKYPVREQDVDPDIVWIAYDTPLDDKGFPVIDQVILRIQCLHAIVPMSIPFAISCQWPVGTFAQVEQMCQGRTVFYIMENVRVGHAIADFQQRVQVVGRRVDADQTCLQRLFQPNWTVIRTTPETAEFGKHALNGFLALQIAFVNELARLSPTAVCMDDVAQILRSDPRVSEQAPLIAGRPFGGGSLKRDVLVLNTLNPSASTPILAAILPSNES